MLIVTRLVALTRTSGFSRLILPKHDFLPCSRIRHTYVLDDPFDDPPGLEVPPSSPVAIRPAEERVPERVPVEEMLQKDTRTEEEIEDALRKEEAKSRAVVLEMVRWRCATCWSRCTLCSFLYSVVSTHFSFLTATSTFNSVRLVTFQTQTSSPLRMCCSYASCMR